MRFLLYLLVLQAAGRTTPDFFTGLPALLFLAWDVYETLKPGLKIVTMTNPKSQPQHEGSPVASHLASLLEQRKRCAQTNNCVECQKFLEQFQALMVGQDPIENFNKAKLTGGPEPVQNGHGHGGGGYL